jgi:16S rRNA (cytidine1402-2'-O)-methyltransferase
MLYIVGTPIGNLGDMSPRGIETLRKADFIAAEDTRVTRKLLSHFDIRTPMVSYHEHNRKESGEKIIARLLGGESCALVTDAGMPAVSDPGQDLIRLCAENDIPIAVVPGPSAVTAAVALSELVGGRFCFEGFLTVSKRNRREHLKALENEVRAMVFYEAPHKLLYTLKDMLEHFGERNITIARELTKLHEEVLRTTLSAAVTRYEQSPPKGELVLIVQGSKTLTGNERVDAPVDLAREYVEQGLSTRDAVRRAATETGFPRSELYRLMVGGKAEL